MTRYDAERQIDILHAIEDDLRRAEAIARWSAAPGQPGEAMPADLRRLCERADEKIACWRWADLVNELRREIVLRRRFYPAWAKKGTLDPVRARHQLERLEAVHFRYWVQMEHFMPDELWQHRAAIASTDGPERAAFRAAIRAHRARFTPGTTRGEYAAPSTPATAPEPELALA